MNHQAIIEQLTHLAPQLKGAESPEAVLVKYASEKNYSPAQLERIGQVYNIAKTLNFMDKSASRGDSFRVLDTEKMLADFTAHKANTKAASWKGWTAEAATTKSASTIDPDDINSWLDTPTLEKEAKILEEGGQFVIYNRDGTKKLSKPMPKDQAEKRLRQIEYFKHRKEASGVPNILAMAADAEYSPNVFTGNLELPKASFQDVIKDELRKESFARYEIDQVGQLIDDSKDELLKIANDLLDMHKMSPLPYNVMERDAVYCSDAPEQIKAATAAIADYFGQRGWTLERHDFNTAAPRLVRDNHNTLPLFKSAADKIELIKSASAYREDFEKKFAATHAPKHVSLPPDQGGGSPYEEKKEVGLVDEAMESLFNKNPDLIGGRQQKGPDIVGLPEDPDEGETYMDDKAVDRMRMGSPPRQGEGEKRKEDGGKPEDFSSVLSGISGMYRHDTYLGTHKSIGDVIKSLRQGTQNTRQKKIDTSRDDVGRVTTLQRLMLTDPIVGEAEPDTVVDIYNTLARANPEIVKDVNLLRMALREAIQYESVPLHTYKDLLSMGKDRMDTMERSTRLDEAKYRV